MSQPQIIKIPEVFEDFFACRFVLTANHQYPGNIQRRFRLQNCLSRKSSLSRKYSKSFRLQNCLSRKSTISRKYSKTFSPAELSQPQIIIIPEISTDVFACRIVLASNHQYPENTQSLFRLQNCLTHKSLISRKYSQTFLACRTVLPANHQYPGNIQRLFCLQKCLSRKSSKSWKYSKTFLPAEMSQPQIISIPEISKDVFACRTVLAANLHYPENTQSLFACRIVLAANQQYPGNIQRLFRLQNRLSRKSSLSRKYPKTFSLAELSQPQIINIPKILKNFFACRIVLPASH